MAAFRGAIKLVPILSFKGRNTFQFLYRDGSEGIESGTSYFLPWKLRLSRFYLTDVHIWYFFIHTFQLLN